MSTHTAFTPAQAFPAGEYLRDELDARGWSVTDFAEILGRPQQAVSEILNGHKQITVSTAAEIAAATGTDASTWLRLQDAYELWRQHQHGDGKLSDVQRRARMRALVPVAELRARGALPNGGIDEQERAICDLLGIDDIGERPAFKVAARRRADDGAVSPAQIAWLSLVRRAATKMRTARYSRQSAESLAAGLSVTVRDANAIRTLPRAFAKSGIRLVYVKPFRSSKIDGVAFDDGRGPVIGLSGRIARLDSVVFTLLHELAHVTLGHIDRGYAIDLDLASETTNRNERAADRKAAVWSLPDAINVNPPFTRSVVLRCADELGVHPALVVGRLQHDGLLPWSYLRALLPSVRGELEAW